MNTWETIVGAEECIRSLTHAQGALLPCLSGYFGQGVLGPNRGAGIPDSFESASVINVVTREVPGSHEADGVDEVPTDVPGTPAGDTRSGSFQTDTFSNGSRADKLRIPSLVSEAPRGNGGAALISGIAREVLQKHAANPGRTVVAGLSAGAAMAVVAGQTYPELFAAVDAHSGLAYGNAHDMVSAMAAMKDGRSGLPELQDVNASEAAHGAKAGYMLNRKHHAGGDYQRTPFQTHRTALRWQVEAPHTVHKALVFLVVALCVRGRTDLTSSRFYDPPHCAKHASPEGPALGLLFARRSTDDPCLCCNRSGTGACPQRRWRNT